MQGRLSPLVHGKIQAFPWDTWQQEFSAAHALGLALMEWTLDQDRLYSNPLLSPQGQLEIRTLCRQNCISIPSLTGDCFMQSPFWKASGHERTRLKDDFTSIASSCPAVGIQTLVVPLVDNGRLETVEQENILIEFMHAQVKSFRSFGLQIAFESDFSPVEFVRFIRRLPSDVFGVNYDIGNSAALGYKPEEEFAAYGSRIFNVHVKDRNFGGSTVPLGTGDADFPKVFRLLYETAYSGNFIMQTARAPDEDHSGALLQYMGQLDNWARGL